MRDVTHSSIPVFIINLPESIDRKDFMKTQCESLGVSPVFIDAVYGKDLSKSDIERYTDQNTAKKIFGRELLLGEIGCALSHKKIYQKIVDENIPYAVILEDDVIFEEEFSETVKSILTSDRNWELILLGHHKDTYKGLSSPLSIWGNSCINSKFSLNRLADFGFGGYGYMITLEGAKKLVIKLDKIYKPLDHYTPDSNILNVYALFPTIVNVRNNFETLIGNHEERFFSRERFLVKILEKTHVINTLRKARGLFRVIKPIKKYK